MLEAPGETAQLAVMVRDQNDRAMTRLPVAWESSDERTAKVDAKGRVTAVASGSATITATVGEASGTSEVMVIDMEWAAEFMARQHVVDAVQNLAMRVDPNCTVDCETKWFSGPGSIDLGGHQKGRRSGHGS